MKKPFYFLALVIFFAGCSSGPVPIEYGHDGCAHCKMIISDKAYGAEIVTKKGKVYKYDATECMLLAVRDGAVNPVDIGSWLVTDASNPGVLVPVGNVKFLISEHLPSPMGGNISAFGSDAALNEAASEYPGDVLTWEQLRDQYLLADKQPARH